MRGPGGGYWATARDPDAVGRFDLSALVDGTERDGAARGARSGQRYIASLLLGSAGGSIVRPFRARSSIPAYSDSSFAGSV